MQDRLVARLLNTLVRLLFAGVALIAVISTLRFTINRWGHGFALQAVTMTDLIAIISAAVALLAFLAAYWFSRRAREDGLRVEKSTAYLSLEMASSEVFKYEAEKDAELKPYRTVYAAPSARKRLGGRSNAKIAYNLYFQTLNLFEVCARFRRQSIIEHQVFASWVAWFYDTLDDWYFREMWYDLRSNYTDDVRDIFDLGTAIFARHGEEAPAGDDAEAVLDAARKAEFYAAVAAQMQCREIAGWLDKTEKRAIAPPPLKGPIGHWLISIGLMTPPPPKRSPASSPGPSATTPAT
ncbi:hypothetical protein P6144_02090 [Sphingomonas sp. HITSZ_GF]|uniref:hypothetical protein n=1 Tax=Sphingomonas sp. HITSZ_GF TaxID=3037247 RepID=UPI00240D20B8|nr:hypothetical protein [Sphingomonas sp. HITSZ_GF]MDG2532423.1 hypothetical protein [Sphingomonas sp. HITSZ_GF]